MSASATDSFHPLLQQWFAEAVGTPTDVQQQAWPLIAAGKHLLVTAPTGSGKTLTAFLAAIDRLARGHYPCGQTSVLYVSPMKALNADIRRNLQQPLDALRERFTAAGANLPPIRVQTRSGDTPASERARMLRRPPEILITTPESLNLLLTTTSGRTALETVRTVILDEVHAVVATRRGIHLITAIERLAAAAGEFQRIALSATVQPLAPVAQWLGGFLANGQAREVATVIGRDRRQLDVDVQLPEAAGAAMAAGEPIWSPIAAALSAFAQAHRSTLVFTNSRRLAERLVSSINAEHPETLAHAHHGSLSREIRQAVESRLKAGELRAIVATSSLELGIDIGDLDRVVMVQTPPEIASAVQRTGRAGHRVGAVSQGTLLPTHDHDCLAAVALKTAVDAGDIEPTQPLDGALDVLAQVIVSTTAYATVGIDALYRQLRCSYPYRHLDRVQFDLVLDMLCGRYESARVQSLAPRLMRDGLRQTLTARRGAVLALYAAGGMIPDRGYYRLRHAHDNTLIGELDEEFVWEAKVGNLFTFGSRVWRVRAITHDDVFAEAARPSTTMPPFYRSEGLSRSHHFSLRIGEFLSDSDALLRAADGGDQLRVRLQTAHACNTTAADLLVDYLQRQRAHTNCALPHRHHLVVEHALAGPGGYRGAEHDHQIVLHTCWGGRVNRPLALALAAAWQQRFGSVPDVHVENDAIAVLAAERPDTPTLLGLVSSANVTTLLRATLAGSAFFGARFRECAGRALLLAPRRVGSGRRQPLWMTRLDAARLLTAVAPMADFPILLETWRTCLDDEFDLPALCARLDEVEAGHIHVSTCTTTTPSPFARQITFSQISRFMYADDTPPASAGVGGLREDLVATVARSGSLRPQLAADVIADYRARRQRLAPGYAPQDAADLVDWVCERVALTEVEWRTLCAAVTATTGSASTDTVATALPSLALLVTADERRFVVGRALAATLLRELCPHAALYDLASQRRIEPAENVDARDAATLVTEALAFHGPLTATDCSRVLPADDRLQALLSLLIDDQRIVAGVRSDAGGEEMLCETSALEVLLRMQRASRQPIFEAVAVTALPAFLARWQQFDANDITTALGALAGLPATAALFERELLPARLAGYSPLTLDAALREGRWYWRGAGTGRLVFVNDEVGDLWPRTEAVTEAADTTEVAAATQTAEGQSVHFADPDARYSFFQLADASGNDTAAFSSRLWSEIWAGAITGDDFTAVRAGIDADFSLSAVAAKSDPDRQRQLRARAVRARSRGWPGVFRHTPRPPQRDDAIDDLTLDRERARQLLERYGVLTRELAARDGLAWKSLFRALRLMELAGDVVAGYFVSGLSGPQFADPGALRVLADPARGIFWCNVLDPVSPCGLGAEWPDLPRRVPGNHLVFRDGALVLVSEKFGERLTIRVDADDADLPQLLAPLRHLLERAIDRRRSLTVAEINGQRAVDSEYLPALRGNFDVLVDHRSVQVRPQASARPKGAFTAGY